MANRVDASRTRNDLRAMFYKWDIDQFSIQREVEEYADGRMKRGEGVTVTYFRKGQWQTVFCNHGVSFADNMRSIFLFLDRVRIAEKAGISYQGLSSTKDLTTTTATNGNTEAEINLEDAYDVLGVIAEDTIELIKRVYQTKVQWYHPDKGGEEKKFIRITKAYETIMKARGVK